MTVDEAEFLKSIKSIILLNRNPCFCFCPKGILHVAATAMPLQQNACRVGSPLSLETSVFSGSRGFPQHSK